MASVPIEEQAKVNVPEDDFYPVDIDEELDEQIDAAVEAIAECAVGQGIENFLDLENLVALIAGEAPFPNDDSFEASVQMREAYGELKALFKDGLEEERDAVIKAGGLYVPMIRYICMIILCVVIIIIIVIYIYIYIYIYIQGGRPLRAGLRLSNTHTLLFLY